jgi:hypothetical protein
MPSSIAEELSRRGFVVLNVDAYAVGLSEQPTSDDFEQGVAAWNLNNGGFGELDALNYLKTLKYVDTTRIGAYGQSLGARRVSFLGTTDSAYYSFNDIMVNVLFNTFGVKLAQSEITQDADTLAQKYLPADKMDYYNYLKAQNSATYNSRIKSICIAGTLAGVVGPATTVTVGGYEVTRTCKVNMGLINAEWDFSNAAYPTTDAAKKAWYTDKDIQPSTWYTLDDNKQSSEIIGDFSTVSITSNTNLKQAIADCTARLFVVGQNESHSKQNFSATTTAFVIKYFEQTLNYNNGNLTDSSTKPIDAGNLICFIRAALNCIAMFAMLFMVFPLAKLFMREKKFAYNTEEIADLGSNFNNLKYWIIAAVTIGVTFWAVYSANGAGINSIVPSKWFRLPTTNNSGLVFFLYIGLISIIMLAVNVIITKKTTGKTGLQSLNIAIRLTDILKYFAIALGIVGACYLSLAIIDYLFLQDYRLWMTSFTFMKADSWVMAIPYIVLFIPIYLLNGTAINYATRKDIPKWLDTLLTIVINVAGIWLCCLVNIMFMKSQGKFFSSFQGTYQLVLIAPITVYISRKMYTLTKSIWLGAFVNAMLIVWSMFSTEGCGDFYFPQSIISIFLGS